MFDNLIKTIKENKVLVLILILSLIYKCGKELFSSTSKETMADTDDDTADNDASDSVDGDDSLETGDDIKDELEKDKLKLCKEKEIIPNDCTDKKICKEYKIPKIACNADSILNLVNTEKLKIEKKEFCKKHEIENCKNEDLCKKLEIKDKKCKDDEISKKIKTYRTTKEKTSDILSTFTQDQICAYFKSSSIKKITKADKKDIKEQLCKFDSKVKEYVKQQNNENIDKVALFNNSEKLNNKILSFVLGEGSYISYIDLCTKNEIRKTFINYRQPSDARKKNKIKVELDLAKEIIESAKTYYDLKCEESTK